MWAALGLMGANALLGQQQAKRQREQQYAQNMAEAAQTQYSPWSGMQAGKISTGNSSDLAGGLQGAMAGAQMANSIGAFGKAEAPSAQSTPGAEKARLEEELLGGKKTLYSTPGTWKYMGGTPA